MKRTVPVSGAIAAAMMFALSACSSQEEMASKPKPAPTPAPAAPATAKAPEAAKAKVEKAKGDVGLIDTEKNYMILVTKEGKLVTLDFDAKTKVTKVTPTPSKIADVGLGSSATVTYSQQGAKNIASGVEYKAKKGGE
jgi:ABC-type enterochelin transport system substrate-binding protein